MHPGMCTRPSTHTHPVHCAHPSYTDALMPQAPAHTQTRTRTPTVYTHTPRPHWPLPQRTPENQMEVISICLSGMKQVLFLYF